MEARIAEVVANPPPGVAIDLPLLRSEQQDRARWRSMALARIPRTDWSDLHAAAQDRLGG
jgi:hypothetical protein